MQKKLQKKAELYDSFAESREKALAKWAYTDPKWRAGRLFDTLMALRASQYVEIGCGAGLLGGEFFGVRGARYIGLDISMGMLKLTRDAREPYRSLLVCAAAEQLPFADKSIECIVADCTIQACAVPETALSEIMRVAKKWLVVSWVARVEVGEMIEQAMRETGFRIAEAHIYRRLMPHAYMHYQVYVGERKEYAP